MEEAEGATERSNLLAILPSPASTNEPSRSDALHVYGASSNGLPQADSAASFELLLPAQSTARHGHKGFFKPAALWVRQRPHSSIAVFLMTTGLVTLLCFAMMGPSGRYSLPGRLPRDPPLVADERAPFSTLHPVDDLGLFHLKRPEDTSPPKSVLRQSGHGALPTNAWYQNMLMAKGEPTDVHRVCSIPYVIDACGTIPGLRAHPNHILSSTTVVQLSFVDSHGITIGAAPVEQHLRNNKVAPSKKYSVISSTALAVTLQWKAIPMSASIVKGMPYTTMHYPKSVFSETGPLMLPAIASEMALATAPIADRKIELSCDHEAARVEKELQLSFEESDFTWLIFFSEPVLVKCIEQPTSAEATAVLLQVVDIAEPARKESPEYLTIRAALLNNCTHGENNIYCAYRETPAQISKFAAFLRQNADVYPGPQADVRYDIDNKKDMADLIFDWDARNMRSSGNGRENLQVNLNQTNLRADSYGDDKVATPQLITYALPHHLHRMTADYMPWGIERYCTATLTGSSCIVSGASWTLREDLPSTSFYAPRPPKPDAVYAISTALKGDISFKLADYYERGAGDTYFSGKMLAKLARILLIAEEVKGLCTQKGKIEGGYCLAEDEVAAYSAACHNVTLVTDEEISDGVSRLRKSVEIWLDGAEIPFVYDTAWGGVISCGCQFDSKSQSCSNKFPECPVISDPGMDFGNGFYNDHHFHYGYHIYAAAAVAHFDPKWGRDHFEEVLLLVRDIANPSVADTHFPVTRHKDWYQGNSWASGVPLPPYPNGKNQESSSEAIASYEAVAIYGQEMVKAWENENNDRMATVAAHVRDVGRLLTATEIRAADYYWHVRQNNESMRIYPDSYTQHVVGIVWSSAMVQFQTWFGNAPYLAIGIQLLPLTAIAESRDQPDWTKEMYPEFAESCGAVDTCMKQGWSVLQLATLATVGHIDLAIERVQQLPLDVFESAGGNGHSLTNTLWYVATRAKVEPLKLAQDSSASKAVDCGIPDKCTETVLNTDAKGTTCLSRIDWLMTAMAYSEAHACHKVAGEFPYTCGACDPGADAVSEYKNITSQCPPCSKEECLSDLNRCPRFGTTFVCTQGRNIGGCSPTPWTLNGGQCIKCCEVAACLDYENFEPDVSPEVEDVLPADEENDGGPTSCAKCDKYICTAKINLCPVKSAPFLCVEGRNTGGCSPWPWQTDDCKKCCDLELSCLS